MGMIERCMDLRRIKRISDANPDMTGFRWSLPFTPQVYYLMEVDKGEDLGVWAYEPHEGDLRGHAAMGPKCRGRDAIRSLKESFDWIWRNTDCRRIIADIPVSYTHVLMFVRNAGMCYQSENAGIRRYCMERN